MRTASTKQRGPKKKARAAAAASTGTKPVAGATPARSALTTQATTDDVPERVWLIASGAILLVAALLRLYAPALNPLHHDEGVNGYFLTRLLREGVYQYDPSNYHGPTLYYFTLLPVAVFGLNTFAIRFAPAIAGVATVWLALYLRRHTGTVGALTAAALLAVSPGAVYNSRYFIHESLFVFFTVALVVSAIWFYDTGRARYVLLAAASAALLFATKETAFISVGAIILATGVAWGYVLVANVWAGIGEKRRPQGEAKDGGAGARGGSPNRFDDTARVALSLLGAAALFVFIYVLFYSSFFTYRGGIGASFETFKVWTKTASKDHTKSFDTYLAWLQQEEASIYVLAIIGAMWALLARVKNRFAVFTGAWAFGLLLAYSIVKYKTPWLMLNFIAPMAIVGGYGVGILNDAAQRLATKKRREFAALLLLGAVAAVYAFLYSDYYKSGGLFNRQVLLTLLGLIIAAVGAGTVGVFSNKKQNLWRAHVTALTLAFVAVAVCAYQSLVLNFRQYDNEQYPYVYAHTQRETLDLVREVERMAERTGKGKQTGINIASPDYWPLPWYFREYPRAGFHSQVLTFYDTGQTPIVIGKDSQAAQLRAVLGSDYEQVGDLYALRPGVKLVLFARRDLAGR